MAYKKRKVFGLNLFTGLMVAGVTVVAVKFADEIKAQLLNVPVIKDWL